MNRTRACGAPEAGKRLHDAEAFLEIAEVADDPDVKAMNAIHAAIAAADAICCREIGERSAGQDHRQSVELLTRVDKQLASHLRRSLEKKTQAAYGSDDVSATDADRCVVYAQRLVEAARRRVQTN